LIILSRSVMVRPVPAMPAVHKKMHAHAYAEDEDQRQVSQDVRLVFLPQEEPTDGQKNQQT